MPKILYKVALTRDERTELEKISRNGHHGSQKVLNALILLGVDSGEFQNSKKTTVQLAETLQVSTRKVDRVKRRFVENGLDVALNKRKANRQHLKKLDAEAEAKLLALAQTAPPEGHAQWTLRLLADKIVELGYVDSLSYETVRRVLKKS